MLTNIYNYNANVNKGPDDDVVLLKLGKLRISSFAIMTGIISALISIPVNIIIVVLFTKRKMRAKKVKDSKEENSLDKYKAKSDGQEEQSKKTSEDDEDDDVETSLLENLYDTFLIFRNYTNFKKF